ncbi:DUF1653 domain-containing protein [Frigoribacterium sp. 2-23]|uniref:DUF1653 domain-containing protein n=1 Tax=Frigoribacterium sp. 2-23 TaxID=3415006 RepID=UPI003C7040FA
MPDDDTTLPTDHPRPGVYEHFKGSRYLVIATARHSETEEALVVYRTLYGDYSTWVRPLSMFVEHVERDGYSGPRFRPVVLDGETVREPGARD